jgi:hypothetical protein
LIRKAFPLLAAALILSSLGSAHAQADSATSTPMTPFERQIHHFDLAITGVGQYNTTVTGPVIKPAAPNYCDYGTTPASGCGTQSLTQYGSNTFGALVTIRYVAKPYVGFEFNYGYARYTENFTGPAAVDNFPAGFFQVQTKATEYTLGYVATPRHTIFGLQPYAGGGVGSISFKPTPHGGEGAPEQARMAYYYGLGLQQEYMNGHFGLRAGFRQLFFLDPDFEENYLTIKKQASTYEPQAGFYLRY